MRRAALQSHTAPTNRVALLGRAVLMAAIALVLATPPAAADIEGAGSEDELTLLSLTVDDHPDVEAVVSAPDATGARTGEAVFSVAEGGVAVADVTVEPIAGDTQRVVMALDTSGSMDGTALALAQDAAVGFVERLSTGTEVAVIAFAAEVEVLIPFTDQSDDVVAAIRRAEAGGETALNDAVLAAIGLFDDADTERSIVLLTDGGDTVSTASATSARSGLASSDATLYAVGLASDETDFEALDDFVAAGSGQLVRADDPTALAAVYDQVARQLTSLYRLGWTSAATDRTQLVIDLTSAVGGESLGTIQVDVDYPAAIAPADPATDRADVTADGTADGTGDVTADAATGATGTAADDQASTTADDVAAGPFGVDWRLGAGLGAVGFGIFIALLLLVSPRYRTRSLAEPDHAPATDQPSMSAAGTRLVGLSTGALQRSGADRRLDQRIDRAGWSIGPGELVAVTAATTVVVVIGGLAVGDWPVAVLLAITPAALVAGGLHVAARRRQAAFALQLEPTLQMLVGALRAGFGLTQAAATVAREADSPMADEFHRALRETQLGHDLAQALRLMARRMDNEDMGWVADAIEINRTVGGNLAEVLDNVTDTIRGRAKLDRQVKALSAEGRLSGRLLLALPIGVFTWLSFTNPVYMGHLTSTTVGLVALGIGVVSMALGARWIGRIVRIDY